jgi:hypothetical protein
MLSVQAQSLSELSDSELETKKADAIAAENYDLANQIKAEQNARKSIDDKLKEKNEELKAAIASEDFEKAEQLKKDIAQLEKDKAKLTELEEDKKIAIFEERYDDVIAIEKQMLAIKKGENKIDKTNTVNTNTQSNQITNAINQTLPPSSSNHSKKDKLQKVGLDEVEYSEKIINQFGIAFSSNNYTETYYDYYNNPDVVEYSDPITSFNYISNRWWINKYISSGYFADFVYDGGYDASYLSFGGNITAFADINPIILPYTSFGIGLGQELFFEEIFVPTIFRVGTYVFFNKKRSIGLYVEFNKYFNDFEAPKFRFGVAWSRVKRRARK